MSRNRSAVVIGGASGIGAAIATRHKNAGDEVVVWDLVADADIVCDITESGPGGAGGENAFEDRPSGPGDNQRRGWAPRTPERCTTR